MQNAKVCWPYTLIQRVPLATILVVIALLCIKHTENIDLKYALVGWGPMDWVNHLVLPEQLVRDFPSGIAAYEKSIFMYVYPAALHLFQVAPENLLPLVVAFEILFFAFAVVHFSKSFLARIDGPVIAIIVLGLLASYGRGFDLSYFGAPAFVGLYYTFSEGTRLLGLSTLLRGQYVRAGLWLAASFATHPVMGAAGIVWGAALLLFVPTSTIQKAKNLFVWVLALGLPSIAWLVLKLGKAELGSGGLDAQTWLDVARIFNYHMFPTANGLLTELHYSRFLPAIAFLGLTILYLHDGALKKAAAPGMLAGVLLMAVITALGLLLSATYPQPFLVKLMPHRFSGLLNTIGLIIVMAGLWRDCFSASLPIRCLAAVLLVSPFAYSPGFPVAAVLAVLGFKLWSVHERKDRLVVGAAAAAVVACVAYYVLAWWHPAAVVAYVGPRDYWYFAGGAVVLALGTWGMERLRYLRASYLAQLGAVVFLSAVAVVWVKNGWFEVGFDVTRAKQFKETQDWARQSTNPRALFLVDPTIYYGWRDFSQRSSFGNLREWLHTSVLYDSRAELFRLGLGRLREFNMDYAPYVDVRPALQGYRKLTDELKIKFYALSDDQLLQVAERNKVDYIIFSRKDVIRSPALPVAFQNDGFIVLAIPSSPLVRPGLPQ